MSKRLSTPAIVAKFPDTNFRSINDVEMKRNRLERNRARAKVARKARRRNR